MISQLSGRARRRLEMVVSSQLEVGPVIPLHGPRTVGKSTLLDQTARTSAAGAEVDLVLERDDGGVVGLDVKASGGPPAPKDRGGLRVLRNLSGEAFLGGVLPYLGERSYRTPEGFVLLPVDRLWNP